MRGGGAGRRRRKRRRVCSHFGTKLPKLGHKVAHSRSKFPYKAASAKFDQFDELELFQSLAGRLGKHGRKVPEHFPEVDVVANLRES